MTAKEQLFIDYYLGRANYNASKAARLAGYSLRTAAVIGWENLQKPLIQAAIQKRIAEAAMGADEVLARLADHARASLDDFLAEDGSLDLAAAREAGKMHLLREYACEEVREAGADDELPSMVRKQRIKVVDAQAALVTLGRHHKLWVDRQELTGEAGGPVALKVIKGVDPEKV